MTLFFGGEGGFTPPCKARQPLRGMELQEKAEDYRLQKICLERTYS